MIGTELKQAQAKLKTLDRDFQEQLTKLARARRTAYLSVGHGELNDSPRGKSDEIGARSASIARTLLQRLNYLVKDIGLAQGLAKEVPDDADLVVILGPTEPFAPEELAALDRYVKRNGKLFLALDEVRQGSPAPSTLAFGSRTMRHRHWGIARYVSGPRLGRRATLG